MLKDDLLGGKKVEISCLDKFLRCLVMKAYDTVAVGGEEGAKRDFFFQYGRFWSILTVMGLINL